MNLAVAFANLWFYAKALTPAPASGTRLSRFFAALQLLPALPAQQQGSYSPMQDREFAPFAPAFFSLIAGLLSAFIFVPVAAANILLGHRDRVFYMVYVGLVLLQLILICILPVLLG